jgi:porphobilinogen synthase
MKLGVPALALFPVIDAKPEDAGRPRSLEPEGLVPRVVQGLKKEFPELARDDRRRPRPFTSHGQDGLLDETGYILNDETSKCW